jgi:hypothetical protein
MAEPETAELRRLLICVGTRAAENAALWRWCTTCFLEPSRDAISFIYARSDSTLVLVRRCAPVPTALNALQR